MLEVGVDMSTKNLEKVVAKPTTAMVTLAVPIGMKDEWLAVKKLAKGKGYRVKPEEVLATIMAAILIEIKELEDGNNKTVK